MKRALEAPSVRDAELQRAESSGCSPGVLLVVVTLQPFALYPGTRSPIPVLIALLVCDPNDHRRLISATHRRMDRGPAQLLMPFEPSSAHVNLSSSIDSTITLATGGDKFYRFLRTK